MLKLFPLCSTENHNADKIFKLPTNRASKEASAGETAMLEILHGVATGVEI